MPQTPTEPIAWLVWHNIHGLMGGRAFYIDESGNAIARIVERRLQIRYRDVLSATHMRENSEALHDANFLHKTVPERGEIPTKAVPFSS